tara:strand:+ start:10058 stop:13543 length:3486 start_codon:yes stop_codon:yes gene_type:complete
MIQFTKLRLNGFKSFVDKTELEIGTGLNGIVGPNGCGKSNLVEALRWIMGESSAKRMRGGGMEDVIFAGTDKRSARNFAEVSLLLDNSTYKAPAAYNKSDEIEISRKIEKDKGSGYRINGKSVRARDVQMLFADTITGANSPSMVSQGHVARMINAKPHDRRLVLEESAGIAGLYARRHEAELRLKGADTNLIRVDDILGSMEGRLNSLKRQARQATKYKNLSAQIRQIELAVIYLEWLVLVEKQKEFKGNFAEAESSVAENLTTVSQLTRTQNTQIEELPPLRKKEAELSATLQKHKLDFQRIEDELKRYKNDLQEAKTQLHQTSIDRQHEDHTLEETSTMLGKIEEEYKILIDEQERDETLHTEKRQKSDDLKVKLIGIEEHYSALKEDAAANTARLESLRNQIERYEQRKETLQERYDTMSAEREACVISEQTFKDIKAVESEAVQYETQLQSLKETQDNVRDDIQNHEAKIDEARTQLSEVEKEYAHVSAEISVLEQFFSADADEEFESVLDHVMPDAGFEKALSRALGDSLLASLDAHAPTYWQAMSADAPAPDFGKDIKPMLSFVKAPEALHLALSYIGYVASRDDGQALSKTLKPGQSLVSGDGAYWRWDGYFIQDTATDRHSVYLEQKNKQSALDKQKDVVQAELDQAKERMDTATLEHNEAKGKLVDLNEEIRTTEQKLNALRPKLQQLKDKNMRIEADQKRYDEQISNIKEDLQSVEDVLDSDKHALAALVQSQNSGDKNEDVINDVKAQLDRLKEQYQEAVRDFDLFSQGRNTRRARIQAIADERLSLKNRNIRAKEHLKQLEKRHADLSEKLNTLESNPIARRNNTQEMLDQIATLESEKTQASERLATCETDVSVTNKALKEAENILGGMREKRAHTQALLSSINDQIADMEHAVEEKQGMHPKDLVQHTTIDLVAYGTQDLPKLKQQNESLVRERDSIGPVNLRAEEEATEIETELGGLLHERNDLIQAIEELRGAINKINKEARERLVAAFEHVNAHFQHLFSRLFAGGKAYLELIDSDDPLGAGLEIYAQPPGKSLQSLSLLSGGEQTLTSIALIFGMFLTNPSPICVLDEIDAALDDANVDRVCDLLDEISERGETRFLVVTHHRLTMARMDRLYGVTMSEKGVSQLVSVDLQKSFEFIDQKVA